MSVAQFAKAGLAVLLGAAGPVAAADYPQPLAVEPTPSVAKLPERYPTNWIFVHDLHFNSLIDGRAAIVDVAAPNDAYKGQIPVAQFGNFIAAKTRPEIYVAETFLSRMTRGDRTDVITIWDKATLVPKGEIALPDAKRGMFVTLANSFQLTNDEKWALVFNFTPGSSVTVVDLQARAALSTIDLPGCSLVYPTGPRGFMSLCADGTMTSVALNPQGQIANSVTSAVFNDIDNDPLFMTPAMKGTTAWFASFKGRIRGIDLSGAVARDLGDFVLPQEKTKDGEWRPGGWQIITADAQGRLYVLMDPAGKEGSHKNGGTEVWVVDPIKKARTSRIALKNRSISVEVTAQSQPLLVASNADGSLDVYDAATGAFARNIPRVANDPYTMSAVRQ